MRRIVLLGLLFAIACVGATAPHVTQSMNVVSTQSVTGVFPGDTFHIVATPLDGNGGIVFFDTVVYSSSNTSIATVTSGGLVTALTPGSVNIFAATDGQTAHLPINVDGNVTGKILVTPPIPTMSTGTQLQLTANVYTTLNDSARNKTVIWSTSDAGKATVDAAGNVSAVAATTPTVSICATASDAPAIKGCAAVTVH